MSEADTSTNHSLPEPTASMEDSTADVPEASGASEESHVVNFIEVRDFRGVDEPSGQQQPIESDVVETVALSSSELDELSTETPLERRSNDADWFALAQKMRQRNHRLHEQVSELRQALKEKQEALHLELMRSHDKDALIVQQAEEINTVQEQLARLFHALEASHQAAQRQQILIETLSEQLQSSQERVAQLERECSFTQQRYNEQSQQLLQAANTCRELRTRLQRQQRQTMQFKVALEKSLEMTSSSHSSGQQLPYGKAGTYPFPKTHPIQPWSAQSEFLQDEENFASVWNRPISIETAKVYSSPNEPQAGAKPLDELIEEASVNLELLTLSSIRNLEETKHSITPEDTSVLPETTDEVSPDIDASELELEQQLLNEMSSLAEAAGLSESQPDLVTIQEPLALEPAAEPEEPEQRSLYLVDTQQSEVPEDTQEVDTDAEREFEELWAAFDPAIDDDEPEGEDDEAEPQKEVSLPQSNWPSPTLYPLRRPKKLGSLAAIDLPSFPRYRPI
ncbi:MAG TPA: hypothetical protein V6C91_04555 [Coleofasciculaceae cyanobacterium]